MDALLLLVVLLGQLDDGIPPAPAPRQELPAVTPSLSVKPALPDTSSQDEQRAWLLARLILDRRLDSGQASATAGMLERMNEAQLKSLVAAYREQDAQQSVPWNRGGRDAVPAANQASPVPRSPAELDKPGSTSGPGLSGELEAARRELRQAERLRDQLRQELAWRRASQSDWSMMTWRTLALRQQMELQNMPFTYGGFIAAPVPLPGLLPYGGWGVGAPQMGFVNYPW